MDLKRTIELIEERGYKEDDIHIAFISKDYAYDYWRSGLNRRMSCIKDLHGKKYEPMIADANGYVWKTNPVLLDQESIFYQEFEAVGWDYIKMFFDDSTDIDDSLDFYLSETDDLFDELNKFRRNKLMIDNGWDSETADTYLVMSDAKWRHEWND
jgi:hypothetical protein